MAKLQAAIDRSLLASSHYVESSMVMRGGSIIAEARSTRNHQFALNYVQKKNLT